MSAPSPLRGDPLTRLCQHNVREQLHNLLTHPGVRQRVHEGTLELVGMYFDLATSRTYLLDPDLHRFTAVDGPTPGRPD
jgi:carbonic anhydrase